MIAEIVLFLVVTAAVGLVNLILSLPLERSPKRELASYVGVVMGGIAAFTLGIVAVSYFFQ